VSNPAFNRAAWFGEKPLVAPLHQPYDVGDIVSCREPVDADGFPTIRGIVLDVESNDDGEAYVTIAREVARRGIRRAGQPSYTYRREQHAASELDADAVQRSTPHDRYPAWRAAARIAVSVAYDHQQSSKAWTDEERFLLGAALRLAALDYREAA
jgi:hypothetical protein